MSTPAIALTAAEGEAIERARNALGWIRASTFPWAFARCGEIRACEAGLTESLDDYAGLTSVPPREHPASLFPDLGRGQDDALATALDRVTADIREWTRELVAVARAAEKAFRAWEGRRAA